MVPWGAGGGGGVGGGKGFISMISFLVLTRPIVWAGHGAGTIRRPTNYGWVELGGSLMTGGLNWSVDHVAEIGWHA